MIKGSLGSRMAPLVEALVQLGKTKEEGGAGLAQRG
jgi:hypothetical protein